MDGPSGTRGAALLTQVHDRKEKMRTTGLRQQPQRTGLRGVADCRGLQCIAIGRPCSRRCAVHGGRTAVLQYSMRARQLARDAMDGGECIQTSQNMRAAETEKRIYSF